MFKISFKYVLIKQHMLIIEKKEDWGIKNKIETSHKPIILSIFIYPVLQIDNF